MEVTCHNCSSRFNLPDHLAKVGVKLRCSVCKTVFALDESHMGGRVPLSDLDLDGLGGKKPSFMQRIFGGRLVSTILILLVLMAAGGGGYWYLHMRPMESKGPSDAANVSRKVEKLTMRNVRQYYVNNDKIGQLFVIEGRVVNGFPAVKELIQVEGSLYGADKKPLLSKVVHAGTALSLFQLQVLGEKELESFLSNKIEILTNNTNIQPGGEVPFMIVFYNPPQGVVEFGVKIVDVRDPKAD